jgi:hypothetical protein
VAAVGLHREDGLQPETGWHRSRSVDDVAVAVHRAAGRAGRTPEGPTKLAAAMEFGKDSTQDEATPRSREADERRAKLIGAMP